MDSWRPALAIILSGNKLVETDQHHNVLLANRTSHGRIQICFDLHSGYCSYSDRLLSLVAICYCLIGNKLLDSHYLGAFLISSPDRNSCFYSYLRCSFLNSSFIWSGLSKLVLMDNKTSLLSTTSF